MSVQAAVGERPDSARRSAAAAERVVCAARAPCTSGPAPPTTAPYQSA